MSLSYRVISIGTLAAHPLWNEKGEVRTGHGTSVLISVDDDRHILVDPSLPTQAMLARLNERTNVRPAQVTDIFLTSFQQERRRGLRAFPDATWWAFEPELQAAEAAYREQRDHARDGGDAELIHLIDHELELVDQCKPAPDELAPGVSLFPLPGATPGTCGLLLSLPSSTVVICGDAIPTQEHLDEGKVLPSCVDAELAQDSFKEAVEIADVLILGRDNVLANPMRTM